MNRPNRSNRPSASLAEEIRGFRESLQESQQIFATKLGLSIRALANYEKNRAPDARALVALASAASRADRADLTQLFMTALVEQLQLSELQEGCVASMPRPDEDQNRAGYALLTFRRRDSVRYGRAFVYTFMMLNNGDDGQRGRAKELLDDFATSIEGEYSSKAGSAE